MSGSTRWRAAGTFGPLVCLAMVASGCRGPTGPARDPELLTFSATTEVTNEAPGHLMVTVTATNGTHHTVHLEFGPCPLRLTAYAPGSPDGTPVWEGGPRCITQPLYTVTILPAQTISPEQFSARIPIPQVLGDSLSEGRYDITAEMEFQRGEGSSLTFDTVRFPAGSAVLTPGAQ
jgi:hypothetical protein